jgi:hypothetical protein
MKLYRITDDSFKTRGFPYASGYGPLDGPMPFITGEMRESMLEFWKVNSRKPGLYIDEKGSQWGDFIMCGLGNPDVLIAERVLTSLRMLKCTILTATEFPIAEVRSKKLKNVAPPRYFAVQWGGGISLDWVAMGVAIDKKTGNPLTMPAQLPIRIANSATWNGDDIFSWSNWDVTHLTMLCTEKVFELAKEEKWTNVRFDPVPTS